MASYKWKSTVSINTFYLLYVSAFDCILFSVLHTRIIPASMCCIRFCLPISFRKLKLSNWIPHLINFNMPSGSIKYTYNNTIFKWLFVYLYVLCTILKIKYDDGSSTVLCMDCGSHTQHTHTPPHGPHFFGILVIRSGLSGICWFIVKKSEVKHNWNHLMCRNSIFNFHFFSFYILYS